MTRRIARCAVVAALTLIAASTLDGYKSSGRKWGDKDVPFFVNPVSKTLSESAVLSALQAAAANWPEQSGASIRYYYAGRTSGTTLKNNGMNEVFFRNTTNGSYAGVTYYWYNSDAEIVDADTVFYEGAYRFFGGSSGCSGGVYLEDVATHEFGHALGISHSSDTTATMYPTFSSACSLSWRVLAQDDINGIRAVYPPVVSSPPAAPASLTVAPGSTPTTSTRLTWADRSSTETAFAVERSSNGTSFTRIAQPGSNVTSYTNSGLSAGTKYWYRVYATNSAGPSSYSNTVSITTAPGLVSAPSPANGSTGVLTTAIRWAAAKGAVNYDVYFGTTSSPPKVASAITTLSRSVGTLSHAKKYYWRVVARNSSGTSTGPLWSFTTK
jgi:hypothetical protein